MEQTNEQFERILQHYCDGKATAEEQQAVREWASQSEENRRLLRQTMRLYWATEILQAIKRLDTERALELLHQCMGLRKEVNPWEWMQRAAALLFLPLLVASLLTWFAKPEQPIQMMEAHTAPGMTARVVLPDSSVVWLNSESSLRYPSTFKGSAARQVELKGEGYFEVTKDAKHRFVVEVAHRSRIEVLGTCFNVEAYSQSPAVTTTLVNGKVRFSYEKEKGGRKQFEMKPGEKVVYNGVEGTIHLYRTSGETETAWKDGKIVFNRTSLEEALRILGKRYNVEFRIKEKVGRHSYTGTFTHQRIERILEYFQLSSGLRWRYVDGKDINQEKIHIEIY